MSKSLKVKKVKDILASIHHIVKQHTVMKLWYDSWMFMHWVWNYDCWVEGYLVWWILQEERGRAHVENLIEQKQKETDLQVQTVR